MSNKDKLIKTLKHTKSVKEYDASITISLTSRTIEVNDKKLAQSIINDIIKNEK